MAKHSEPRGRRKIIQLKDHLPEQPRETGESLGEEEVPRATIEYGEEEAPKDKPKAWQAPKAFYRVAVVLLVLVVGLAVWVNRDNLTLENITAWVETQVRGDGSGDGYPVAITGSDVAEGNFLSEDGNAVILSDTALTILAPSGQEGLSLRHSFNQPVLKAASGQYLLYNQNSTGYLVANNGEAKLQDSVARDILAGAIAPNGRFALATQGEEGASDVTVYLANGEVQYTYSFAQDYVTALALNADGTWAMACTVRSQDGELISKITVFDLNKPTPAAEVELRDNLLLAAYWGEGGVLYVVGDNSLFRARSSDFAFEEYSFEGRTPTAFCFSGGHAYVSVSAYEHAGACTLLVFRNMESPLEIPAGERITSLAVSGGTVGALEGQVAVLYNASTGEELAREDAGSDAKSLALSSESAAYVLGVSEVRRLLF